ncbi:MAG: hypothetical protein ACK6BQ_15885, partial [Bacteroidota bacterium]
MKINFYLILIASLGLLQNCSNAKAPHKKGSTSLLSYGITMYVNIPKDVDINRRIVGNITEVIVKGKDEKSWFELIVQNLPSESEDLAWNKYLQIEDVRNNVYFTRIMEENENGFIYELVPRDKPTYHFRYVIVQGSQLYIISTALGSELT